VSLGCTDGRERRPSAGPRRRSRLSAHTGFLALPRDVVSCLAALFLPGMFAACCQSTHTHALLTQDATALGTGHVHTYHVLVCALYAPEVVAVFVQLCLEVLRPLKRLFLLGLDGFLLCELAVVVDGAGEGREACGDLALQRGRGARRVGKQVQILAYARRLPEGRVEEGVLARRQQRFVVGATRRRQTMMIAPARVSTRCRLVGAAEA
jgi:hypothetical protein